MSHKDKKLYNYVVNTLGISKDLVMEYVKERMDDLLSKHLRGKLDSNQVERMILNRITEIMEKGFTQTGYWSDPLAFQDFVKSCVRDTVLSHIKDEYEIQVKVVRKSKSTVSHAGQETADIEEK